MLRRPWSLLPLVAAAVFAACASPPPAVEGSGPAGTRVPRRTPASAEPATTAPPRTIPPQATYADEVFTAASPSSTVSPGPSEDAEAPSTGAAIASAVVLPSAAGLVDLGPCNAPEPAATPELAAAALGAYAGQQVPAGWNSTFASEAQVTAAITELARDPAARACFQQRHPGAALVHWRLTELTAPTSDVLRTVTGVQVSLATVVLRAGLKTSVGGTVTYSDGSRDGDVTLSSDNTAVVALDEEPGGIIAVGAGTTTLHVKAAADETQEATITVTVL